MTYEFGMNASDTSDAFDVIKMEGKVNNIAYGVSYFEIGEESDVTSSIPESW